jgi:hypothetical protein
VCDVSYLVSGEEEWWPPAKATVRIHCSKLLRAANPGTKPTMNDLASIKNFGPYMVNIMNQIGICSKEDLLNSDYAQIKKALIEKGINPHMNIFYSIEMGLQNRAWNSISATEKKELMALLQKD